MRISDLRTINTHEKLPEFFYIFTNRNSSKLINKIENYNIALREQGSYVSSAFPLAIADSDFQMKYILGDLDYLPYVQNKGYFGGVNPFNSRVIERYTIEYQLEMYRRNYHKSYPSRFSGIFAFGDYDTCECLSKGKNGWDLKNVKKYKLKELYELNKYIRVVKTNFKIIGYLEHRGNPYYSPGDEAIYEAYWQGKGDFEITFNPNTPFEEKKTQMIHLREEYLIEGILEEVE